MTTRTFLTSLFVAPLAGFVPKRVNLDRVRLELLRLVIAGPWGDPKVRKEFWALLRKHPELLGPWRFRRSFKWPIEAP